jgi:transposase
MWPAFMKAARKHLPEADLLHDKFHVAKHLGEAVDAVRKQEHRALTQQADLRLKGAKYLVLKNPDKLNEVQRQRFEALHDSNLKTARAWAIKEQFKGFWQHDFIVDARACFQRWYSWAIRSRLCPIKRKVRMLKRHLEGLLGYTLHPVINAATEGLNSKIQHLKASARGFRNFQRYRTAILFHCGKLNLLPEVAQTLRPQKS